MPVEYPTRFIEKFNSRINKNGKVLPTMKDACWEWISKNPNGKYGRIKYGKIVLGSHRLSWELSFGDIPDGLWVLHKCDNPKCVNPNHLFLGNRSDNIRDAISKGRHPLFIQLSGLNYSQAGELNHNSKLTENQVLEIKNRYVRHKITQRMLANEYGVSREQIGCILRNQRWTHVSSKK